MPKASVLWHERYRMHSQAADIAVLVHLLWQLRLRGAPVGARLLLRLLLLLGAIG